MESTMKLLDRALAKQPISKWHESLGLSEDAIYVAKHAGKLSPVIAGAMAMELGEDPMHWAGVAALEAARPSKCRDRLMRRLKGREKP